MAIQGVENMTGRKDLALTTWHQVGLAEEHYFRFPHELSGGKVQR